MQLTMKTLLNKELYLGAWLGYPISAKTMRKECKRWGLVPVDWDGRQPKFDAEEVERAKKRRKEARLANWS